MKYRKPTNSEVEAWALDKLENGTLLQKRELYSIVMREVFHMVTWEELEEEFEKLSPDERELLAEQANGLLKMKIWEWLNRTILVKIERNIYLKCKDDFDLAINKVGLWVE